MEKFKSILEDLSNESLENKINLASIAILGNSGKLIYQTENWDISKDTQEILNLFDKKGSITINNMKFNVTSIDSNGITTTSEVGMGYLLFAKIGNGYIASYALPGGNPARGLEIIQKFSDRIKELF